MISMYCGKVEDLLSNFRPDFFDACLCDPPYGLKFMGKSWDHGVPSKVIWEQVKRTLKPGAPILAFGGSRTYHRLACAIEDAGFEIFDSILGSVWITGQGFPKSLAIDKAIDKALGTAGGYGEPKSAAHAGWIDRGRMRGDQGHEGFQRPWMQDEEAVDRAARHYIAGTPEAAAWKGYSTHLKPAWEPVVFARKPLSGTYAENCIEHGCGGLNIDGCRVGTQDNLNGGRYSAHGAGEKDGNAYGQGINKRTPGGYQQPEGRYPANLLLSHHPDCSPLGTRRVPLRGGDIKPNSKGSGPRSNQVYGRDASDRGEWTAYKGKDGLEEVEAWECHPECPVTALDRQSGPRGSNSMVSGPPASTDRFLTGLGNNQHHDTRSAGGASRFFYCAKVSTRERNAGLPPDLRCDHPTLKPIDLCRYLATLILPPARINQPRNLLIPFAGAGSEIIGATIAGWESITAIEKEYLYIEQAWYRIKSRTGVEPVIFD